jgi:invasion protein IalB
MTLNRTLVLTATVAVLLAGNALAQVPQRTTATYADWTVRCVMQDKSKSCEMAQTIQIKGRPQPISQIAIGRQTKDGQLKMVFEVPIDVWLPDGAELVTAQKQANVSAKFTRCIPAGCFAEADISATTIKELRSLKKNGKLQFKDARKQLVAIPVSFKGFSDAYDALQK